MNFRTIFELIGYIVHIIIPVTNKMQKEKSCECAKIFESIIDAIVVSLMKKLTYTFNIEKSHCHISE